MARKTMKRAMNYYASLCGAWVSSRIFLSLYPIIGGTIVAPNRWRAVDPYVLRFLRKLPKRASSILYVYDLPIEQNIAAENPVDKKAYALERMILECFDILCVFNKNVRETLVRRYGIESERFVEFEVLDYGVDFVPPVIKAPADAGWTIVYTGNCDSQHLGSWVKELPYSPDFQFHFLGPGCNWVSDRSDIIYKGLLGTTEDLARYLSAKAHFGMVASSDSYRKYYEYTSTSKFAAYIAAGVPVLVRADYEYLSSLVRKYGVGLVFGAYEELPSLIRKVTWSEYTVIRDKCLKLGLSLRSGRFFKTAVSHALEKLLVN